MRGRLETAIDVTALIDAAFILIIFLLVTTAFKKKDTAFSVSLPTATEQELVVRLDRNSVHVTKEGDFFFLRNSALDDPGEAQVEAEKLTEAELQASVRTLVDQDENVEISLVIDERTPYRHIVAAISALRGAGVQNVQLPYEHEAPPEGDPAPSKE